MPIKSGITVRNKCDKWHLDEVVFTIDGQKYYLWRAVDSEGNVLDILMQSRRDTLIGKEVLS